MNGQLQLPTNSGNDVENKTPCFMWLITKEPLSGHHQSFLSGTTRTSGSGGDDGHHQGQLLVDCMDMKGIYCSITNRSWNMNQKK